MNIRSVMRGLAFTSLTLLASTMNFGIIFGVIRAGAEEMSQGVAASQPSGVTVISLERVLGGNRVLSIYAPELKMVRLEIGNRVTVIDLPRQRVWWLAKESQQLVNEQSFAQLTRAEQAVRWDTKKFTGFEIPALEIFRVHDWQLMPTVVRHSGTQQPLICQTIELKNRLGEVSSMCVRRELTIQQLAFLANYFEQLPTQLKRDLEASEEVFLYGQGLVPILGKRRGRSFELRSFKSAVVAATLFQRPSSYEKSASRYVAEESYYQAMKRSSKAAALIKPRPR